MNELLKEFISYIFEQKPKGNKPLSPAEQAKEAGYKYIKGTRGLWSKTGKSPAEATTRDDTFRVLTPAEKKSLATGERQKTPAVGVTPPTSTDPVDTARLAASSNPNLDKLFGYVSRQSSRISRMMALSAFEITISERLKSDQQNRAQTLKSGIESLLLANSKGQINLAKSLAKELHKEFKFYSNAAGTTFKTQAFGMSERHFLGKTALAKDLVEIFKKLGIDLRAEEDQDRGFKKGLSRTSKPDLGEPHGFKSSKMVQKVLSAFPQIPTEYKQLFGPTGKDGDLLDNTGGKNCRTYFEHSVQNNKSLEKTEALLRSRGLDKMADAVKEHQAEMTDIAKNWNKYSPAQREQAVAESYASMAVKLHSTKFGGDTELCGAIMKNLAEVNLYDQELAGEKEVYMPSHGSFPAADKLVRVKGGTKAERIDKISVKYGKTGRIYGMPAQSNTVCLLHPDSFYHNLTGGRVGMPGYETGVNSEVVLTDKVWERMMKESGYSRYIPEKQRKELLAQYKKLQSVIEQERNKLKRKNIKDIVLMMKDNPNIEKARRDMERVTSKAADALEEHIGTNSVNLIRKHPLSFASLMTTHASIRTAKGFPDLLHCHQEIEDTYDSGQAKFAMGVDVGDDNLHHWLPLWREADERGGGLLIGFSKG